MEERQKYEANQRRRTQQFQDLDYICCSSYGRPRGASFCYKPFKQLLRENDLPNIRFHDLRHTYATLLLKQDLSVKAISTSLGHAKTMISVDVYGDKRKMIAERVDKLQPFVEEVMPDERARIQENNFPYRYTIVSETLINFWLEESQVK